MQDFEYVGKWWLPDNEEDEVTGTITFSTHQGLCLRLVGSFRDSKDLPTPQTHNLIVGVTQEGKLITLVRCQESGSHQSYPGFATQEYMVSRAFVGAHFIDTNHMLFYKVIVEYDYLFDWTQHSGFNNRELHNEDNTRTLEVVYTTSKPLKAITPNSSITISSNIAIQETLKEQFLRQEARFTIDLVEPITFDNLMSNFVVPLQGFCSLATARPNAINKILVLSKNTDVWGIDSERLNWPIEVFFQPIYRQTKPAKMLIDSDMLFSLPDIEINFQAIIERWLSLWKELNTVYVLFFGTQYNPSAYIEARFLTIVQAAEIYHRLRGNNQVLPKSEFKRRSKAILHSAPEEFKEWLRSILSVISNEPRLKQRVKDLFEITSDVIAPLISDPDTFAKKVTDTRNYFTHYGEQLRDKAVTTGSELYWLTETLSLLLQRCFLHELGFTSQECVMLFNRNRRYKFTIRQVDSLEDSAEE